MKIIYCLIVLSQIINNTYCQTIINGDFEINSAPTCEWNMTNPSYNNFMSNSWGFGNNTSSGIDIQRTSCGYSNSPSNTWFVSICWTPGSGTDALSLKIDTNLIAGNTYQIGYYDYSSDDFGYSLTALIIGLSIDSLTFGDSIYSSLPSVNSWTFQTFSFVAPNNGKYLTIQNHALPPSVAWNFVDGFHFISSTGINNSLTQLSINIYPTIFTNQINIDSQNNEISDITIYDNTARQILQRKFSNAVALNTEHFPKGVYFYIVSH